MSATTMISTLSRLVGQRWRFTVPSTFVRSQRKRNLDVASSRMYSSPTPLVGVRTLSSYGQSTASTVRDGHTGDSVATEASLRYDLAVAHRLHAIFGFDEIVFNHISIRLPVEAGHGENAFLITPGTKGYWEIRPEDLVVATAANAGDPTVSGNITGPIIHGAIYEARPDINSIVHGHDSVVVAVGCLEDGLECLTQDSILFYNSVGYHEYEGISMDIDEMGRLGASLPPPKHTLMMRNHGALTTGSSVAAAWVNWFYLYRTCEVLIMVYSSQKKIHRPAVKVVEKTHKLLNFSFPPGVQEWGALKRMVEKKLPI